MPELIKEKLPKKRVSYLPDIGLFAVGCLSAYILADNLHILNESLIPWSIASALFYIASRTADKVSTIRGLHIIKESETLGIPQEVYEGNPHLPDRPTTKDLFHPKILALEISNLIPSIIFPPFGAIFGTVFFYEAIRNTSIYLGIKKEINQSKQV